MRFKVPATVLVFSFIFPHPTRATDAGPSFDCAAVKTSAEKAICGDHQLAKRDKQMADTYQSVLHRLPQDQQDALRQSQRVWIKERDRECPKTYNHACFDLYLLYSERILELNSYLHLSVETDLTTYRDKKYGFEISYSKQMHLSQEVASAWDLSLDSHFKNWGVPVFGLYLGEKHYVYPEMGVRIILNPGPTAAIACPVDFSDPNRNYLIEVINGLNYKISDDGTNLGMSGAYGYGLVRYMTYAKGYCIDIERFRTSGFPVKDGHTDEWKDQTTYQIVKSLKFL